MTRSRRTPLAGLLALVLALTGCTGLPTDGAVNAGLGVGGVDTSSDITFLPDGPSAGASPDEIVEGFLEAGTSPAGGWEIAQQFLSPALAETWRPDAGVTVDAPGASRTIEAVVDAEAGLAAVDVTLTPVASIDAAGTYRESPGGTAEAPYELARNAQGEWRITSAPDGIVLDEQSFAQVFRRYSLQYFDPAWQHLVPDPRWFPRRPTIATRITEAVIAGAPSEWLAASVRTAFPSDVSLAVSSVPVTGQVADVTLSASASDLDPLVLGRMRTQLERSLATLGVTEVRFFAEGRRLEAEAVDIVSNRIDSTTFVLTDDTFGSLVGDEVTALPGVTDAVMSIEGTVLAIDLAGDGLSAAVQVGEGIHRAVDGRTDEVDPRPGLIGPSMDTDDFIWSVPRDLPQELVAWAPDGTPYPIAAAWTEASAVSHVRISPDGVRVAAVITAGGQEWLTLSGIIRDGEGYPVELGPLEPVRRLPAAVRGLAWLGEDALGVLTREGETAQLLEVVVGGPGSSSVVPADTVAIAGANSITGARLLSASGAVSIKRGTTWQESFAGALLLATQSGK